MTTPPSSRPLAAPPLVLALGLAGLTLAACATPAAAPAALSAGTSAPAPRENFDWFRHDDAGEASLAYGEHETDNVWLALSCRRGAGRLELLQPVASGHAPAIRLESGGETETYAARAEEDGLDDGLILSGDAATGDPVFQRFRRVGWLALLDDQGERTLMVPHPQTAAEIERFFAFCS